jgi:membrane-associated protein
MWQDIINLFTQAFISFSSFTPQLAIVLFLICLIGEGFIISIPLALDLIWLTAGAQLRNGTLPVLDLIGLVLVAILGRQTGALILYYLSHKGSKFFTRFITRRIPKKLPDNGSASNLINKVDSISVFGVAAGRLLWLRIPLTLLLGARGRLKTLMAGIVLSSVIYEAIYIGLGAGLGAVFGITSNKKYAFLYFVVALVMLYGLIFAIRFLFRVVKRRLTARSAMKDQIKNNNDG